MRQSALRRLILWLWQKESGFAQKSMPTNSYVITQRVTYRRKTGRKKEKKKLLCSASNPSDPFLTMNVPEFTPFESIAKVESNIRGPPPLAEHPCEGAVDFDGPDDAANPVNWSSSYKWSIVGVISIMSLVVWVSCRCIFETV